MQASKVELTVKFTYVFERKRNICVDVYHKQRKNRKKEKRENEREKRGGGKDASQRFISEDFLYPST